MGIGARTRARVWHVVLLAALAAHAAACGQPEVETAPPVATLDPDVPVTVMGGELRGAATDGNPDIVAFRGVPYAAPPVGDPRWKPPRPAVAWDGVRDASAPGLHEAAGRLFRSFAASRRARPAC